MRVVAIAIITALLSAGCAIQAGDPTPEQTERPNDLVGLVNGDQAGVNTHPQVLNHTTVGQAGPSEDSPNPSPWTEQGNNSGGQGGGPNGVPPGQGVGGSNQDNPNPSPWTNSANGAHMGNGGNGTGG